MEIIPILSVCRNKISYCMSFVKMDLDDILQKTERYDKIYVYDIDGMERNKPNLNVIQRLSEFKELWVCSFPRFAEDVIDPLVAGAEYIIFDLSYSSVTEINAAYEFSENIIPKMKMSVVKNIIYDLKHTDLQIKKIVLPYEDKMSLRYVNEYLIDYEIYIECLNEKTIPNISQVHGLMIPMDVSQ